MKRKTFSNEFKAKVALEAIKGHRTANELASEFEVHTTQVNSWKKQLLSNASDLFARGAEKQQAEHELSAGKLYEEIGRLKIEVDWLKKKTGHLG
jgi:transposase-like protein